MSPPLDRLRANLAGIRARIDSARARSPHAAPEVELLVVTKSAPVAMFALLHAAGVRAVGENRLPSARERKAQAPREWTWHGIGHLQRNKARMAVETFDVFHALDRTSLVEQLGRLLAGSGRTWPVYVQVNAAEDPAKGGIRPSEVPAFLDAAACVGELEVRGFMTMAQLGGSEGDVRATFRTLRDVRSEALRRGVGRVSPCGLSMGMTDDFDIAVEEGATIVRVGRAIFDGVAVETADPAHLARDTGNNHPGNNDPGNNEDRT